MAKANRRSRHIVVNDVEYRWRTKFSDDGLSLSVWPAYRRGTMVVCRFGLAALATKQPNGNVHYSQFLVVTPRIVQRVIAHALQHSAYEPHGSKGTVAVRPENIDLTDAIRA